MHDLFLALFTAEQIGGLWRVLTLATRYVFLSLGIAHANHTCRRASRSRRTLLRFVLRRRRRRLMMSGWALVVA